MILRKVSNLRPEDHIRLHDGPVTRLIGVEHLPESKLCVLKIDRVLEETRHTVFADDYVEIVIL